MRYRLATTTRAARCHRRISTRCSTPSESWQYESQRFLGEVRDWNAVKQALASAVAGTAEFPGGHSPIPFGVAPPPPPAPGAPRERTTWALELAYLGSEFDAFTWQPDRERTVMGLLAGFMPHCSTKFRRRNGLSNAPALHPFRTVQDRSGP